MRYEILNDKGEVVNAIIADDDFVEEHFPGKARLVVVDPESDEEIAKANAPVIAEIQAIEATQGRALREAALNMPGAAARLQVIEDKIAGIRSKLKAKQPKP